MNLKNKCLTWLSQTLSIPKIKASTPSRILAVSTTALGDTLWTMPALASLRKSFPEAYLAILTSRIGLEVIENNPWTDASYLMQKSFSLWHHLRGQFDTIILFHASQRITLPLCAMLGASKIVGTKGMSKGLDHLLTDPVIYSGEHEINRRLALVKKIGGTAHFQKLSFFLKPEEKKTFSGCWIALHPGAADRYKCWPIEHFATLGNALKSHFVCDILITGSRRESVLMKELAQKIPGSHLADDSLSLRSFAGLLSGVDLLICNDSGPFHLACAVDTPAIGIYSPTDPSRCGPVVCPSAMALFKPRTCQPCLGRRCAQPFCLLQIGPNEVLQQALHYLKEKIH